MKRGKKGEREKRVVDAEVLTQVGAVYAELEGRLATLERSCQVSTRCCRFQLTGEVPVLTLGEALLAKMKYNSTREMKHGKKFH
jgi:hypothetical protein